MRSGVLSVALALALAAAAGAYVVASAGEHPVTGHAATVHATTADSAHPEASADHATVDHVLVSGASDEPESFYQRTSRELLEIEASQGSGAALAELDRRSTSDSQVAGVCHAIAHDLGHAAFTAAKGDASKALSDRDDVCGGGFTHGIIELALGSSKHPARDLLTVCAPNQDGSCFHGVGHGLMFATGMDVVKALALCDRAPASILSSRCGEGVFMQLFSADVAGGHMAAAGYVPPTMASAREMCTVTRLPYAANCWFYSPTLWLQANPDDFSGAVDWCRGASSTLGRQLCARGVGSRTIKYHPDDPTVGARVCSMAGALTDSCLSGMGSYWSVHFKGERAPSDVCSHLGSRALERRCLAVT